MEQNKMNCDPLSGMPLAYSYVPVQTFGTTYDAKKALCRGTLFPELDLPLGVYGHNFNMEDQKCTVNEVKPSLRWGEFDGK